MSYPVIILGAGASFDYIHEKSTTRDGKFKPPITNELLDSRFEDIIKKFPEVEPLSAKIAAGLRNEQSLEMILREVKDKAAKNEWAQRQLIAFEFYLQELFQKISDNYSGQSANNYLALINEIKTNGDQAVLATFNYDTLLDQTLRVGGEFNDYISSGIKLIKIHGSCDWRYAYNQTGRFMIDHKDPNNGYKLLINNPWVIEKDGFKTQLFSLRSRMTDRSQESRLIPALAIPLPNKSNIICPPEHYLALVGALKQTKQILIIGWSASDDSLIKLIEDNITPTVSVTIVSGHDSIKNIKQKMAHLEKSKKIVFTAEHVGFSNFMGSINCKTFFNQVDANVNS